MSQKLLLVDKNDNLVGFSDFESAHTDRGKRHRAFVTALFDSKGRILIQKRKHELFDGLWDLTAISHNLRIGGRNESYQEASDRAIKKEMGIMPVPVKKIGAFNYFVRDGRNCENEYCAILVGKYDGKIKPNIREVYSTKSVFFDDFIKDITLNPQKYTPWAKLAAAKIKETPLLGFGDELNKFLSEFNPYFNAYFDKKIRSVPKDLPLIKGFYKNLADFSLGGKNLRPFLVFLGYKIAGGKDISKILPICASIELIHSFLLIHDDIIDKSDSRRGKPTMHKRYEKKYGEHYGVSQAILLGDIANLEAMKLIEDSGFGKDTKKQTLTKVLNVLFETVYGEALDVEYSYKKVSLSKILQMTTLKTAKYTFAGPLSVGAKLAGFQKSKIDALAEFGVDVGTVFQIHDDILGIFGDEKKLGKSTLSDMREGKNTILIYKARELASKKDREILNKLWGKKDARISDLKKVSEIVKKSGVLFWCDKEKQRLAKKAKGYIKNITADLHYQGILEEVIDFVGSREN